MTYKPVVDIIGDVVAKVRAKFDPTGLEKPYYMHGHITEIINTLSEKTANDEWKFKKYPVIMLLQDFEERFPVVAGYVSDVELKVVIATNTQPTIKADERYDSTFPNTLYPLFQLFIKELEKSPNVNSRRFEFKKTDRLFWGKSDIYGNSGNIGHDYLDAIELTINLKIIQNCN